MFEDDLQKLLDLAVETAEMQQLLRLRQARVITEKFFMRTAADSFDGPIVESQVVRQVAKNREQIVALQMRITGALA